MIAAALLLLAPPPPPTVGDTIRVTLPLAAGAGSTMRLGAWELPPALEPVDPPVVVRRDGGLELVVTLVAWEPGLHRVPLPSLIRETAGGADTLRLDPVDVRVASVLPPGVPDSALKPRPEAEVVPLSTTTPVPLLGTLVLGALAVAPLWWWWRRRGPAMPARAAPPAEPMWPWLARWMAAGEARTAAAAAHVLLSHRDVPGGTGDDARDRVLQALEDARFAPSGAGLEAAVRAALDLAERTDQRP